MKKRITITAAAALCAASMALGAAASGVITEITAQIRPDFTIKVDGEVMQFKSATGKAVYPILHDGTTYLPLRAIGNLMGKTVYWNEAEKLIELKETTVTDADVIIGGADAKTDIVVNDHKEPQKTEPKINQDIISIEKAKELALQKAGITTSDVIFEKAELDRDNGSLVYEIEFKKGEIEYDIDVNAENGEILSFEKDRD